MYVHGKRRAALWSTILGMALVSAGSQHAFAGEPQFTDVTEAAGLADDDFLTLTNHGLGLDWIDYDNDGWPDLFVVNGYGLPWPTHLYHNDHDGTFTKVDELLPALPNIELTGAVFADYDNDGDMDIYVLVAHQFMFIHGDNVGDGPPNMLFKNLWVENGGQIQPGKPLFVDVAAAAGVDGVLDKPLGPDYPASCAYAGGWLDYDRDGWIDLYVGNMVVQSGGEISNVDTFYRNNGDGTFTDVTVESNVNPGTDPELNRPTLAFLGADLNHDMWPDMYVVNIHDPSPFHHDFLFINNQDGTFTEITSAMPGIGDDSGSGMGIDFADIDLDGNWDIYITDRFDSDNDALPLGNVLYYGNPDGTWQDNTAPEAGVESDFSWGLNFFDVNQDGYEDLFIGAGYDKVMFINNHDRTFTQMSRQESGIDTMSIARGSAVADYDRDGDLDLVMVTNGAGMYLFRNNTPGAGHWLEVNLVAVQSNRAAIGALVQVQAGGLNLMRQVLGGSSAHSQDELLVHFGLGDATVVDELKITWPSGIEDVFHNVSADQLLTVVEVDGVIDLRDFAAFQLCYTGPCAPSCAPPLTAECRIMDDNFDGDVDAEDLAEFVAALTGPQ